MSVKQGGNTIAGGGTVDQTYNPASTNAQSGTAVAGAIANMVTTNDLSAVHVVIETGTSGNNWYRKWSDGWLEQGGIADYGSDARSTNATITFPKAFSNTNYTIQYLAQRSGTSGNCNGASGCRNKSKTGIYLAWYGNGSNDYMRYFNWYAAGF